MDNSEKKVEMNS